MNNENMHSTYYSDGVIYPDRDLRGYIEHMKIFQRITQIPRTNETPTHKESYPDPNSFKKHTSKAIHNIV